jgi:hypothetical protein
MKISDMIRQALEKKGFKNLKDASKVLGISPELLRVTINKGHIPKDSQVKFRRGKRKYPLSEEQTNYLEKILSVDEIMLIRKFRQVTDEAMVQITGYVDFMFASKKRT